MSKNSTTPATSQDLSFLSSPSLSPCGGDGECLAEASPLLYLYSNNSTGSSENRHEKEQLLASCGVLTPYHKRQAHTLFLNADRFVSQCSLDFIAFLTLTTPDNCVDYKELGKRWDSFNNHYFKKSPDFLCYLGVKERQERGAVHLHLLVRVAQDVRTGFDWESYLESNRLKHSGQKWRNKANECYRSAQPYLREHLWPDLRFNLPKYGFGRSELLPIRTSVHAVSRYMGGYLGKNLSHRQARDKGMRVMFADQSWVKHSSRFQFLTEGSKEWREKVALFAMILKCGTMKDLKERLGDKWCYRYRDAIMGIRETWAGVEEAPF